MATWVLNRDCYADIFADAHRCGYIRINLHMSDIARYMRILMRTFASIHGKFTVNGVENAQNPPCTKNYPPEKRFPPPRKIQLHSWQGNLSTEKLTSSQDSRMTWYQDQMILYLSLPPHPTHPTLIIFCPLMNCINKLQKVMPWVAFGGMWQIYKLWFWKS